MYVCMSVEARDQPWLFFLRCCVPCFYFKDFFLIIHKHIGMCTLVQLPMKTRRGHQFLWNPSEKVVVSILSMAAQAL